MIELFTIGFTNKSAETFFDLLRCNQVRRLIDTRINNSSQLAGFSKGRDLSFFAKNLIGAEYVHRTDMAPTQELLKRYREKKLSWSDYESEYLGLLRNRQIESKIELRLLDRACLVCSEDRPDQCHRRLLADYLKDFFPEISITHL